MRSVVVFHGWCNAVEPHDFVMQGFKKIPGDLFFPQGPISVPEDRFIDFCRKQNTAEQVIAAVSKLPHFAWWDAQASEAGPDLKHYLGWEDISLPYLVDYFTTHGPFDAMVGFSQGALLAVLLATLSQLPEYSVFRVKGICCIGSPHNNRSAAHAALFQERRIALPALLLHGASDKVCVAEDAEQIAAHFVEGSVVRRTYPGGHHCPRDAETLGALKAWMDEL